MSVATFPEIDYEQQAIDLEIAIKALRSDPSNEFLMADVAALLLPLARKWAWQISLSVEDNQDAESAILAHCLQAALPESHRRISPQTGKPAAGYGKAGGGNVASFFYGTARRKAFDILKGRRRAWKRECVIMRSLFDFGALLSASVGSQVVDAEQNRYAGSALP